MLIRNKTDWGLLARYLAGEAGESEKASVDKWLNKSADNRKLFENIRSDWKVMDNMRKFDVDNAWEKLHTRIQAADSYTPPVTLHNHRVFAWSGMMKIAASLLVLAMLSLAVYMITGKPGTVTVVTASHDQRVITLPDGSRISMNEESQVRYAKDFVKETRDVELKGEAFFEVSPDKKHPFIIHSGNAEVKVVGTSFNVETGRSSGQVEVYVSTGMVQLYEHGNESNKIMLHPGEVGTLNNKTILGKKAENENALAWKTGRMDFRRISMAEAVKMLNKVYHANIICDDPSLAHMPLTGEYRFPDEPLDTILAVLCQQHQMEGMKIEKSGNKIYLRSTKSE